MKRFQNKSKAIALPLEVEAQNRELGHVIREQQKKLLSFIRKRVPDQDEAEDILQDVFYQFVETHRLMKPVEQVGAWLFRVARNRITDKFRKKKPERLGDMAGGRDENGEPLYLSEILPSDDYSAETKMMNDGLMEEIYKALDELPKAQREVFMMHEIEELSFAEMAERTGESINTLLSRKRYAVIALKEKLKGVYTEFMA